jgi:DNA protecting protein DprA
MIAVVGTRRPTVEAEHFARTLAQQLVAHGFAVISGGAAGIDTAAHEGALSGAGSTLVVAPAGWYEPYPESNRNLFRQIVNRGGGYISLVEPDQRALTPNFFARNAVLVALSRATVVIQAPLRSGARNSAHVARKIGRLLFVVPSAPWVETGAGCTVELRLGARPLGTLADLLTGLSEHGVHGSRDPLQLELPLSGPACGKRSRKRQVTEKSRNSVPATDFPHSWGGLSELSPVTQALELGCDTLDSICLRSGWNAPQVQSALLRLTLAGCIRISSAGRIEVLTC